MVVNDLVRIQKKAKESKNMKVESKKEHQKFRKALENANESNENEIEWCINKINITQQELRKLKT